MHHLPALYITLTLAIFCLLPTISLAEKDHGKQQLQSTLQELEQARKQRQQHNTQVEELARRLDCNWTQIRAYEICGQLHPNNPSEHLKCSSIAKQNAARCLQHGGEEE